MGTGFERRNEQDGARRDSRTSERRDEPEGARRDSRTSERRDESDGARRDSRTSEELRARLLWDDARLLAECEVHIHRTGGPGGQHRNKVASAVRLVHRPSGFVVTATERRSQHENKAHALSRLREAIAVGVRCPPVAEIRWPPTVCITDQRLRVSEKNPALCQVVALVLDELAASGGELRKTADRLGVTSSSLTRFLADSPRAWTEANRIRQAAGLAPLRV